MKVLAMSVVYGGNELKLSVEKLNIIPGVSDILESICPMIKVAYANLSLA